MNRKNTRAVKSASAEGISVETVDAEPMGGRLSFHARPGGPVEVILSRYPGIASRYVIPRADAAKMFRELSAYLDRE